MSSSSSPAPHHALASESQPETHPFPYVDAGRGGAGEISGMAPALDFSAEIVRRETAAREAGIREGELRAQAGYEQHLADTRENLRVALAGFAKERELYYHRVEDEVVRLALSIARKILHREAETDPLLLAALVRVALDKIESKTKVIVRVNPRQGEDCRSFFTRCMDPQDLPEIIEDPAVPLDHCVLQTELGTAELGIEPQLQEIEKGLMDLLAQRPPGS